MQILIRVVVVALALSACLAARNTQAAESAMSADAAVRFTQLAMDCIPQEYPNKLGQLLGDATDLQPPKALHPSFYGCYDWHSSVHGHWMLVKALKEYDELPNRDAVFALLEQSLTGDNIARELAYIQQESKSWERMYGWAWLLQLQAELVGWEEPRAKAMAAALQPLAHYIRGRYIEFLPVQTYPVRTGVHPNTAFGMSFAYDYARVVLDRELAELIRQTAMRYYGNDKDCPIAWEPSGEDFLSPCLEEAALMSRVLRAEAFQEWLIEFLPGLNDMAWFSPADVSDRSDPKIVHLDGLNLSRAWSLTLIAGTLDDPNLSAELRAKAEEHLEASLPYVTGDHYVGSHWLGSFAIYALTRR